MNTRPSHRYIAVVGNPNCGKTTIFNGLTGLNQKVSNYAGVTVEKKEGTVRLNDGEEITLLDLPGTYSLSANSPDEKIVTDILMRSRNDVREPNGLLCIVDASNLERNLYLVSQIIDQEYPLLIVLNMIDVADRNGVRVDSDVLSARLGVQVIPTIGNKRVGIADLRAAFRDGFRVSTAVRAWTLPEAVHKEHEELVDLLIARNRLPNSLSRDSETTAVYRASTLLSAARPLEDFRDEVASDILEHVRSAHARLDALGVNRRAVFVDARYAWVRTICQGAITVGAKKRDFTNAIDAVVTHRIWGYVIFFSLMVLMFQSIFTWAAVPMELIGYACDRLGAFVGSLIGPGDLQDLVVSGAIGGVGAVVMFLPQILLLFLFLGVLEDTGYMARAAFLLDRLMTRVGLSGRAFIPMVSSFACAIPGIMATRSIANPRDRLVTMLVAPLMSCSARLPVYSLLIAAFIPGTLVFGFWNLQGIVMVSLYLLGLFMALLIAGLFRRTVARGKSPEFILELPPYRLPSLRSIALQMWERSIVFLKRAGTIILGVSIVLWFLATYPRHDAGTPSERLAASFIGQAGHWIEPVLKPLGFDWKIDIAILCSLLQREVFVSAISTIYNVENADDNTVSLRDQMQKDVDPATGLPKFTALTAICVMVYYVLAMQCMSTVAVMRRETNGWKWPLFQFGYMTVLAYVVTWVVYRVGLLIS